MADERVSTGRLTIEALRPAHAVELHAALADPAVHRYVQTSGPWTVETVRGRLERVAAGPAPDSGDQWLNFAVRHEGRLIGRLEATLHEDLAEIAYLFDPAAWGHGFATEAARWLVDHLRDAHAVTELWATTDPANAASARVLERLGFTRVEEPDPRVQSYDEGDLVYRLGPT